jgi:hypothetical protein
VGAVTEAAGYVRASKVRGRVGDSFLSPDLQREQIAAAARREGLEDVEVLGWRSWTSPGPTEAARSGMRRSGEMASAGQRMPMQGRPGREGGFDVRRAGRA